MNQAFLAFPAGVKTQQATNYLFVGVCVKRSNPYIRSGLVRKQKVRIVALILLAVWVTMIWTCCSVLAIVQSIQRFAIMLVHSQHMHYNKWNRVSNARHYSFQQACCSYKNYNRRFCWRLILVSLKWAAGHRVGNLVFVHYFWLRVTTVGSTNI